MAVEEGNNAGWPDGILKVFEQIGYYGDDLDPEALAQLCNNLGMTGLGLRIPIAEDGTTAELGEVDEKTGLIDLG